MWEYEGFRPVEAGVRETVCALGNGGFGVREAVPGKSPALIATGAPAQQGATATRPCESRTGPYAARPWPTSPAGSAPVPSALYRAGSIPDRGVLFCHIDERAGRHMDAGAAGDRYRAAFTRC